MFWGIYGIWVPKVPNLIEEMEVLALVKAQDLGIQTGEPIILTGATPAGTRGTNFMKILNANNDGAKD